MLDAHIQSISQGQGQRTKSGHCHGNSGAQCARRPLASLGHVRISQHPGWANAHMNSKFQSLHARRSIRTIIQRANAGISKAHPLSPSIHYHHSIDNFVSFGHAFAEQACFSLSGHIASVLDFDHCTRSATQLSPTLRAHPSICS